MKGHLEIYSNEKKINGEIRVKMKFFPALTSFIFPSFILQLTYLLLLLNELKSYFRRKGDNFFKTWQLNFYPIIKSQTESLHFSFQLEKIITF